MQITSPLSPNRTINKCHAVFKIYGLPPPPVSVYIWGYYASNPAVALSIRHKKMSTLMASTSFHHHHNQLHLLLTYIPPLTLSSLPLADPRLSNYHMVTLTRGGAIRYNGVTAVVWWSGEEGDDIIDDCRVVLNYELGIIHYCTYLRNSIFWNSKLSLFIIYIYSALYNNQQIVEHA